MTPFERAIYYQQFYGMAWQDACRKARYYEGLPPYRVASPEPQPYIPTAEEKAKREREAAEWRQRLAFQSERAARDPVQRIQEIMDGMRARGCLEDVNQEVLKGLGEIDQDVATQSERPEGPHFGVLMLRVSCVTRVFIDSLRATRDFEDFASLRIGVYLPCIDRDHPPFHPDDDAERVGVRLRPSNLLLYSSMPLDAPIQPGGVWNHWGTVTEKGDFTFCNDYPRTPAPTSLRDWVASELRSRGPWPPPMPEPLENEEEQPKTKSWYQRLFR